MSSLKDQLLKAGLVSAKQTREAEQQQRRDRKRAGRRRSDVEREAHAAREKRGADRLAERQANDRARGDTNKQARTEMEGVAQSRDLLRRHALRWRGGSRRWHYVARDSTIRSVMVPDELAGRLERGELAIIELVEGGRDGLGLVPSDVAGRVAERDPDALRFLNS